MTTQEPGNNPPQDSSGTEPGDSTLRGRESSRTRFDAYRTRARSGELPRGSIHSSGTVRNARDRVRPTRELLGRFLALLRPFRSRIFWILTSLTASTLLALIPPAGTKFLVDYVLTKQPIPARITDTFPALSTPKTMLLATVLTVVSISILKIVVHIWGRWYATRITKHIQLHVRRRVFEHEAVCVS